MTCSQCGSEYKPLKYPRFIRETEDPRTRTTPEELVELKGKDYAITWVTRDFCKCQWKAQLKLVDVRLLELLLPDAWAQQEIRRRAA